MTACSTVDNPASGRAERTVRDERGEVQQGRDQHEQVLADFGAVKDARLQSYVDGIGQRLAQHSNRPGLAWHFTVLDSPELNAFALPGGYVYVTRGIMAYMDSEADLAGVMGHEIGHVTARHGAQRATRGQQTGLGVLAATVLGAVLEGRGFGGAGYIASYSREQESQADKLGAEYLARAGYNPSNMVDVIRVLKDQDRFLADEARAWGRPVSEQANWLVSHPSSEQRLRDIEQIAVQYKGSYGDDRRDAYLQTINGMVFGESRAQGVTRGRHFFHEPLGIALTAPDGWKIENSSPDTLTLVDPQGSAALVVCTVPPAAGSTHDEILRSLGADPGRAERSTINGMAATRYSGPRRTQQGGQQPLEATLVSGPGSRQFLLLWAARDATALQHAMGPLTQAQSSFRPMTAGDRIAARPWLLRALPYPRGGFAQLARQSPLIDGERELRLLNGIYAGSEPPVGRLVKVVE